MKNKQTHYTSERGIVIHLFETTLPKYLLYNDKKVSFTTYENQPKEVSLLNAIVERHRKHLNDIQDELGPDATYVVVDAILDLYKTEYPDMDKAFVKMFEEGKIHYCEKFYDADGQKWSHKVEPRTRTAAQAMYKRNLAKYVVPLVNGLPDNTGIGWVLHDITLKDFYEIYSSLFFKRIQEGKEKNKVDEKYEKAYEILQELSRKKRFKKSSN